MPAAHRPTGRVTPKGVRPANATTRGRRGERPSATFEHAVARGNHPVLDRRSTVRASIVRTGHRGGR